MPTNCKSSKAIISDGTEEEREVALQSLYTVLEGVLNLMHPFLPFLTEELCKFHPLLEYR